MAYVKKNFSCPKEVWDEFQLYLDEHPEVSYSGLLQNFIRNFNLTQKTGALPYVQSHPQPQTN